MIRELRSGHLKGIRRSAIMPREKGEGATIDHERRKAIASSEKEGKVIINHERKKESNHIIREEGQSGQKS